MLVCEPGREREEERKGIKRGRQMMEMETRREDYGGDRKMTRWRKTYRDMRTTGRGRVREGEEVSKRQRVRRVFVLSSSSLKY